MLTLRRPSFVRGARVAIVAALIGLNAIGPMTAAQADITHSWNTGPAYVPESLAPAPIQNNNPLYTFGNGTVAVAPQGTPAITTPTQPTGNQEGIFQKVGSAFLWIKNSALNLVRQTDANTDLVPSAVQGTWGLRSFQWTTDTGNKGFQLSFTMGDANGDAYYGIAPVYNGSQNPDQIGCRFTLNTTPTANGTLYSAVSVNYLTDEAGITSQIRAVRIYTCATQTLNPDPTVSYPTTQRIMFNRNVAIGSWATDPDRRTASSGTCRTADGSTVNATVGYSPTYTEATGSGSIVRPTCPAGSTLVSVKTDVQTKDTGGNWVTTTPGLFEAAWPQSVINANPACFSGEGCQSSVQPTTNTCTVGTVTSRCVAVIGQVVGTGTTTEEEEPVSGDTQCSVSLNIADTAGCVLRWAFVPTKMEQHTATMKNAVMASPIGTAHSTIQSFTAPYTQITQKAIANPNCMGPAIPMDFVKKDLIIYPFQACPPSPNAVAAMWVRALSRLVIIVSGMYIIIQTILSAFGAGQKIFENTQDIASEARYIKRRDESRAYNQALYNSRKGRR